MGSVYRSTLRFPQRLVPPSPNRLVGSTIWSPRYSDLSERRLSIASRESDKSGEAEGWLRDWTPFATMQNHYNLLNREEEREMLPLCTDQGVGVIPWSPLARGRLTRDWDETSDRSGKDRVLESLYTGMVEPDKSVVEAVRQVAEQRGIPRAQVALAWVASRPEVTAPIVGATKPHHLEDAVAALEVELTSDEPSMLEAPYVPHPVEGY